MIQRIQSLFILVSIGANLALFFLPLLFVHEAMTVTPFDVHLCATKDPLGIYRVNYALIITTSANVILLFAALFLFKKRHAQIRMTQFSLILQILIIAGIFFYADLFLEPFKMKTTINFHWGAYISLIPLLTNFLAVRAIKKDEALIRAADRLR